MKATTFLPVALFALVTMSAVEHSVAMTTEFQDLNRSNAKAQIQALQQKGIVKGMNPQRFSPEMKLTAAEGIQLIVNALQLNIDHIRFFKEPFATDYFPNADNQAWYASALIIAANNGMELPSDLEPTKPWTKEEFTYQLITSMEKQNKLPMIKLVPVKIGDEKQLNPAYQGAVQRALQYGIAAVDRQGDFHPKDPIIREEAVSSVYRALRYLEDKPRMDSSTKIKKDEFNRIANTERVW